MDFILNIKRKVRSIFLKVGLDIRRVRKFDPVMIRLLNYIEKVNIATVFDVGANKGQFGLTLREYGYAGKIISFEPLYEAYKELVSVKDSNWDAYNFALGESSRTDQITVAANSASSSILKMNDEHIKLAPYSAPVGTEEIRVERLSEVCRKHGCSTANALIKVDTQGYELKVLSGASEVLGQARAVYLEISIKPLYVNSPVIMEVLNFMHEAGFVLECLSPGFTDSKTGNVVQYDGLFINRNLN